VLGTDGNGRRDACVEPDQPVDPQKDKRLPGGFYAIMPSVDGSVWGTVGVFAGKSAVVRLDPGPNPLATALAAGPINNNAKPRNKRSLVRAATKNGDRLCEDTLIVKSMC